MVTILTRLAPHPCMSYLPSAAERETRARRVYERAFRGLREGQPDAKEEAVLLLEAWRAFEQGCTSRWAPGGLGERGWGAGRGGGGLDAAVRGWSCRAARAAATNDCGRGVCCRRPGCRTPHGSVPLACLL